MEVFVSTLFYKDGTIDQEVLDRPPTDSFYDGLDEMLGVPSEYSDVVLVAYEVRVANVNGGDSALVRRVRAEVVDV